MSDAEVVALPTDRRATGPDAEFDAVVVGFDRKNPKHPDRGRRSLILEGYNWKDASWAPTSIVGQILGAVRSGAHHKAAAERGGISASTLSTWVARGKEHWPDDGLVKSSQVPREHRPYVAFVQALQARTAGAEVELTNLAMQAAREDKKFALTLLKSRYPHWRDSTRIEMSATDIDDPVALLRNNPAIIAKLAELAHDIEDAQTDPAHLVMQGDMGGDEDEVAGPLEDD